MTTLSSVYTNHHNSYLTSKASEESSFTTSHDTWVADKKDLVVVSLTNIITVNETHLVNTFKVEPVDHSKKWVDIVTILPSVMSATDETRIKTVDQCPKNCRLPLVLKDVNNNSLLTNAKITLVNFKLVAGPRLQVTMRMTVA